MSEKTVIIDYGMGNLHSVHKALLAVGCDATVSSDSALILAADKVILPGVGAFGDCMANLINYGLEQPIQQVLASGKPFLGICLGLQLLFEGSEEAPGVKGLGYFHGTVRRLQTVEKIPHMGWNKLQLVNSSPLLRNSAGKYVYFVHSYHAVPEERDIITATCDYGTEVVSAVGRGSVQAVQFHPEKSSGVGMEILRAFKEWHV